MNSCIDSLKKIINTSKGTCMLLLNLLIVYALYAVCRLLFIWYNIDLYPDLTFDRLMELLAAGLIFDSSAICYSNVLVILLFLFPLHWKEKRITYLIARWIYVVSNMVCLIANLCDIIYFPFTGKRTTCSVFTEFENEGIANLTSIFLDQIGTNWPLLVVAACMAIVLWTGFRSPVSLYEMSFWQKLFHIKKPLSKKDYMTYYISKTIQFIVLGFATWGLMRGGVTHATRPITISNANQYANNPAEAGAILNTPFSLMRTMSKKPLVTPEYMPEEAAENIFSPLHHPKTKTNTQKPKTENQKPNIVILIMESFGKQHFGFFNDVNNENGKSGYKKTFTTFLDSLAANSALTFRYSYSNGRKSIEGMPSILSSIPNFVEPFFLTPASMNNLSGLARELSENKGYKSAFFHGAENGSMGFEAFAKATGFQRYYGKTEYNQDPNYNGEKDFDGTWAIWDEEFLQFYADRMNEMEQPFITAVFTASSHPPFDLPERYKNKFPKGKSGVQECVAYSDNALRQFFSKASKQPWFQNTIFVITSDHVSGQCDPFYETILGHYCVPIIFYAPSLPELRGYDDSTIVEQTDIMPTILGLLEYDIPYVAFGQDILNTPKKDKVALHWVPEYQGYEFVKGNYVMRFADNKVTAVYNLREDLLQKKNIAETMPKQTRDSMETEMKAMIQQYMKCMNQNRMTWQTYSKISTSSAIPNR